MDIEDLKDHDFFEAHVARIIFASESKDFFIVTLNHDGQTFSAKINSMVPLVAGMKLGCEGSWGVYKGQPQFSGEKVMAGLSDEPAWLTKHLGEVLGYRRALIESWVTEAGKDEGGSLRIPDMGTEELKALGLAHNQAEKVEGFFEDFFKNNVFALLSSMGIPDDSMKGIVARLGQEDLLEKIEENPFEMIKVDGIGFAIADDIWLANGGDKLSEARVVGGFMHVLQGLAENGHAYFPANGTATRKVVRDVGVMLNIPTKDVVSLLVSSKSTDVSLVDAPEGKRLYLTEIYDMEVALSDAIAKRVVKDDPWMTASKEEVLAVGLAVTGLELTGDQVDAVIGMTRSYFNVLTGGAGTGKTVVEATLIGLMKEKGLNPRIMAPTGKAAARSTEVSGQPAETVHFACGADAHGDWEFGEGNPLEGVDALGLDEYSMLTTALAYRALAAIPKDAPVFLAGDHNQLPAIGAGNIASALSESDVINVQRLVEIKRTDSHESGINHNAYRVLAQENIEANDECRVHQYAGTDQFVDKIVSLAETKYNQVKNDADYDPVKSIQVLVPRVGGDTGIVALNKRLRNIFNPDVAALERSLQQSVDEGFRPDLPDNVFPRSGGGFFAKGDKLLKMKDNDQKLGLSNGDVAIVLEAGKRFCRIQVGKNILTLNKKQMASFDFGYAMTIHKSQGSEYKHVILGVHDYDSRLFSTNLIYTALTRSKEGIDIVETGSSLAKAIATSLPDRFCGFAQRLKDRVLELRGQELEPSVGN